MTESKNTNNKSDNGNSILQSLLLKFQEKSDAMKIETTIFVQENLNISFMEHEDILSIFGYLFDCAIDTAAISEEGNRRINLDLFMGNKYFLVLKLENTYPKINGCYSTEKDKNKHKNNINVIKKLAKKYGGSLELSQGDETIESFLMVSSYRDINT